MKILFFYEFIDWVMVSETIGKYLGHGAGVIIAAILRIIAIWVVIPASAYVVYLITKFFFNKYLKIII